jgi:tripartite ATP-independent transporter DctP family solute receptor
LTNGSGNEDSSNGVDNNNESGNSSNESADVSDLPEISMTYAHAGPPVIQTHAQRMAVSFKKFIESRTNGKFTVNIAPGGELGTFKEMIEQVLGGEIEMMEAGDIYLANFYSNFNVWSVPYMFPSIGLANFIMRGDFGNRFRKDFRKKTGGRLLSLFVNGGYQHFTTSGASLTSVKSFNDLTIRTVPLVSNQAMVRELGASPQAITFSELYQALDQGVVDGQVNPLEIIFLGNLHEVQDYLLSSKHQIQVTSILSNDKWFQNLHPTYQRLVQQASNVAKQDAEMIMRFYRNNGISALENQGLTINRPPQKFKDKIKNKTQNSVRKTIRQEMDDPGMISELEKALQKAVKKTGYGRFI